MSSNSIQTSSSESLLRRGIVAIAAVLVALAVAVGISLAAGSPAAASVSASSYGVSANTVAAKRAIAKRMAIKRAAVRRAALKRAAVQRAAAKRAAILRAQALTAQRAAAASAGAVTGPTYADGDVFGDWRVVFAGYGAVTANSRNARSIALAPQSVSSPGATSAALAVSTESFTTPTLRVNATVTTTSQLRENTPANAWEVAWLVWDYVDNAHFYYAVAKPNGWELGKRDPAYPGGQRFLATGSGPAVGIGETANLRVVRKVQGNTSRIILNVNNSTVANFVDDEGAYTGGSVGAYTEDADVHFARVAVNGTALLNR